MSHEPNDVIAAAIGPAEYAMFRNIAKELTEALRDTTEECRELMLDMLADVPGLMRTPKWDEPCELIAADFDKPPAMIRREIATAALVGLVSAPDYDNLTYELAATAAVNQADALITALRTIPDPNAEAPR